MTLIPSVILLIIAAAAGLCIGWVWGQNSRVAGRIPHQQEKELQRLRTAFQGSSEGFVFVDDSDCISHVNQVVLEKGLAEESSWSDFLQLLNEDDRQRVDRALKRVREDRKPALARSVYWSGNEKTPVPVDLSFLPVEENPETGDICIAIEFPSARMAGLQYQEIWLDRLQAVIMAIPDALFTTDGEGKIEYWNEAAEKLIGYSSAQVVGRHWREYLFLGCGEPNELEPQVNGITDPLPGFANQERQIVTHEGKRLIVLVSSGPLKNRNGELFGSVTVLKNITPIKALEARLKKRQEELYQANQDLDQLARHRSRFLSHVSHELRTPLNSILGFSGMLLEEISGPLNDEQRKQLELVYKQSQRLLNQINDLLDVARLESRRMQIERESCPLEPIVSNVIDTLQPMALEKNLTLSFKKPEEPLPMVIADGRRLEQILVNLVSNAIKYTPQGEVRVECHVVHRKNSAEMRVDVADTGIGIDPGDHQRIFDEFWRSEGLTEQKSGGLGLGLAITRQLVELLGGTISVNSQPGTGSVFSFTLPIEDGYAVSDPGLEMPPAPMGQCVAIVTEDSSMASSLSRMLTGENLEIVCWSNRQQVECGLREGNCFPFALVIDEPLWGSVEPAVMQLPDNDRVPACFILSLEREGIARTTPRVVFCRKPVLRADLFELLQQAIQSRTENDTASVALSVEDSDKRSES